MEKIIYKYFNKNNWIIDNKAKSYSLFSAKYPVTVNDDDISNLISIYRELGGSDIRLCLHKNKNELAHDMVILQSNNTINRPHWHINKGECFHVIRGKLKVDIFDNQGIIIESLIVEKNGILKIEPESIHSVSSLSDFCIYHESKSGPFMGADDSLFPEWALLEN